MDEFPALIIHNILDFLDKKSLVKMCVMSKRINKAVKNVANEKINRRYPNFFDFYIYYDEEKIVKSSPLLEKLRTKKNNHRCIKQSWWKNVDWIFVLHLFGNLYLFFFFVVKNRKKKKIKLYIKKKKKKKNFKPNFLFFFHSKIIGSLY